ncbi:MAG: pyridoxal-phosphate-dependent aminotransferase family protein [Candidatus Thermochlorobacter sp.]
MKKRLFTPGPTPVPERVMLRMAAPMIHHRNPEFMEILTRVHQDLQYLFQTKQPVLVLTCSGTGGVEATMVSMFSPGDKIIAVNGGKFGERWADMARKYTGNCVELKVQWGTSIQPEEIIKALKAHPDTRGVYFTHSETSTGTATDVKAMAQAIREHSDALICVDGITAVGAHELRFDEWGIDACVTGSQKGLMMPPGLALVALSERAIKAIETAKLPSYYLSLKKALKSYKDNDTPFTPAVSLIIGLDESLQLIKQEGLENIWRRHQRLSAACRTGCEALGMRLFSNSPSYAVTPVWLPEGVEWKNFNKILKFEHGITVAAGQDQYAGKIFRISHLGFYDELDMLTVIGALEMTLKKINYPFEVGSGVSAVMRAFMEEPVSV